MTGSNETRIVLLGKTGSGKSSLGNAILEDDVFEENISPNSETEKSQVVSKHINGALVKVIDTPGFFDNNKRDEKLKREIIKCINDCETEIHAFLIVLQVGRYTEQEKEVINKIKKYFSVKALKHSVVVFTHGDDLNGRKIKDFVEENRDLRDLVEKCGGRCHVVDNKHWKNQQYGDRSNKFQVNQILNTIEKMKKTQGGYTNSLFQVVGKEHKIIIANGVTVGAILGALFGTIVLKSDPRVSAGIGATIGAIVLGVVGAVVAYFSESAQEAALDAGELYYKIEGKKLIIFKQTIPVY